MADPQIFAGPVEVETTEVMPLLREMLEEVPDARVTYAEKYSNPYLLGSPHDLLLQASIDSQVREMHGTVILANALVRVVANQQRRIEELEAKLAKKTTAKAKG
jgi:hypothetical protein